MLKNDYGALAIITRFFNAGHERSITIKRNIAGSFILKGTEMGIGFLRVSIILSFISRSDYGIWLTVGSFVSWFTFLDLGLGNGLLNKLTEALSLKDYPLARSYLSTAYFSLILIMGIFFLIFLLIFPFINWHSVIIPNESENQYLNILILLAFTSFAAQMVLNIITTLLKADQKYAFGQSLGMGGSVAYFILLIISASLLNGNLLILALIAYLPPLLFYSLSTFLLFRKKYALIRPSFRFINRGYFSEIAKLGVKFFIIQIAAIVMFATDNIIITQLSNVEEVVPYNIARFYFGPLSMAYGLILAPLWPAFTDAYIKKDINWIKKVTNKILVLWIALVFAVGIMVFAADTFYKIWTSGRVEVPFILSAIMGLSVIITSWNLPFVYFINGVGKIKLQLYNSVAVMLINIPLSILFARNLKMGTAGIILATCVCLFIGALWVPVQYYKIINNKASGIWNE